MKHLRTFLLACFALFTLDGLTQGLESEFPDLYTIKIESKSFVRIVGRTNVNTFECSYGSDLSSNTFQVGAKTKAGGNTCFEDAVIQLNTISFDCGLKEMTKDFRELLKEDEHPYMTMDVQCLSSDILSNNSGHKSHVKFTIAGISNFYDIPFETKQIEGRVYCSGKKEIKIEDFDIVPPTKFFGLVKVHDIIVVEFNIVLTIEMSTSMSAMSTSNGG